MKKIRFLNGTNIFLISVLTFITVMVIIFVSNRYMNKCINIEADAQQKRSELHSLGEDLANASDYLTDEARLFAITGDITHLYNYWFEVYETKSRDNVILELSKYNPPQNEQALLSEAKVYSDTLIETETISMKLMLISQGKTSKDFKNDYILYNYVSHVLSYELPKEYQNLDSLQMQNTAIEILYNSNYNDYKNLIMSPIQEFQITMNNRLDNEVLITINGRNSASIIQIICSVIVLLLIAILLITFNLLYIKPLNDYADELSQTDNFTNNDFSKVRVTPKGSYELYRFGKIFNHLSFALSTELKNRISAEEKMRIAKDEADKANSAKSQFFAQMSHELRTPLNAINGYLYLLKDTSLDSTQRKYCHNAEISSQELLGLINNILDFSKIESGNLAFEITNFNLLELIQDVHDMMENSANQKGLNLKLETSNVPTFVKGDSLKLKQILINLLGNGIKFTSKGEVKLLVECLQSTQDTYLMEFSVIDTGIGINKEYISKIFRPFIQSNVGITRKYGGTGLGLSISQMIVKDFSNNKYNIEVQSTVGKGSKFSFKMELPKGEESNNHGNHIKTIRTNLNASILLVDDNLINLEIEKEILQRMGLNVITTDNGFNALKILENSKISMILLDLHMPDIDGYQTAKKIRMIKGYEFTPIIALTADVVSGVKEKVKQFDMNDYISKPFEPYKLGMLIEKYLKISQDNPEKLITDSNIIFALEECLSNLNNDTTKLYKLLKLFLDNNKLSCNYIVKHIQQKNYPLARKILHNIIGISGNLCLKRLYNISIKLNQELHEEIVTSTDEFVQVWNETILVVKEYHDKYKSEVVFSPNDVPFNKILNRFIYLCQNYDISALDYFENYYSNFKDGLDKHVFKDIEKHLQQYDFMWIVKNISLDSVSV